MASIKDNAVAGQYAAALLDLANQSQQAQEVARDLEAIAKAVAETPTLGLFLRDPAIGEKQRWDALRKALRGRISPLVMNVLGVLNHHGKLRLVQPLARMYGDLLSRQLGKIDVEVTIAQPFTSDIIDRIQRKISAALEKDAIVHQRVDESIIGGLRVRVEDKVLDATVRAQLDAMCEKMKSAAPRAV